MRKAVEKEITELEKEALHWAELEVDRRHNSKSNFPEQLERSYSILNNNYTSLVALSNLQKDVDTAEQQGRSAAQEKCNPSYEPGAKRKKPISNETMIRAQKITAIINDEGGYPTSVSKLDGTADKTYWDLRMNDVPDEQAARLAKLYGDLHDSVYTKGKLNAVTTYKEGFEKWVAVQGIKSRIDQHGFRYALQEAQARGTFDSWK